MCKVEIQPKGVGSNTVLEIQIRTISITFTENKFFLNF